MVQEDDKDARPERKFKPSTLSLETRVLTTTLIVDLFFIFISIHAVIKRVISFISWEWGWVQMALCNLKNSKNLHLMRMFNLTHYKMIWFHQKVNFQNA